MRSLQHHPLTALVLLGATLTSSAQSLTWIDQFGTADSETTWDGSEDGSGGLYVCGQTYGALFGPNAGDLDAWFGRYDGAGNQQWMRQIGTNLDDAAGACAPDGSGGVFLVGWTLGDLAAPHAGVQDVWLARYDGAGNPLWVRQFGTSANDIAFFAAADGSGGVCIGGLTDGDLGGTLAGGLDAWLARYDGAGNQLWIRQLGTSADDYAVAGAPSSAGGVFLAGSTGGDLGGFGQGLGDGWLAHYSAAGTQSWVRLIGTAESDSAFAVASDEAGGVYVGGNTGGAMGGPALGNSDAWLARYDGTGAQLWTRQLGTSASDGLGGAASNGAGGVYVSGTTMGDLAGVNAGSTDCWFALYGPNGAVSFVQQLGTPQIDSGRASAGAADHLLLAGATQGSLGGPSAGESDAWVGRFDVSCAAAPVTYCTAKVNSLGCTPAIALSSTPSASASSGSNVSAVQVVGGMFGIFFHSTSGANAMPFHGGFLCVQAPLLRHGLQTSGGTAGTCTGSFSESFNAYIASGFDPALVAGAQVWIQNWSRDPAAPFSDGLTDAVTATICP